MTSGELLQDARRRHRVTQRQLAQRARTSQAAISRIERGVVSPTVETLRTFLDLLGEELVLDTRAHDYGHDRVLLRQNLERTVDERIEHGVSLANWSSRFRGVAAGPR